MKSIALLGDPGSQGGTLITTMQDGRLTVGGVAVCAEGSVLDCAVHGQKAVAAITTKSFVNGLLILTDGAIAACGDVIVAPPRGVFVE